MTDPLKIVGRAIRAAREERDWSQEALGERADLHRNEIGVIERGEVNVSLINFFRVCRGLEMSPSKLLKSVTAAELAKLPPKRQQRRREK